MRSRHALRALRRAGEGDFRSLAGKNVTFCVKRDIFLGSGIFVLQEVASFSAHERFNGPYDGGAI
jgi:hypothetical protein